MRDRRKPGTFGATAFVAALLLGANLAAADTTVNLTARRTAVTLPDGTTVPMWGYCGATATGSTGSTSGGSCGATWTPGPTITVTTGETLKINLSNQLPTPTSVVILGQIGGGLGSPNKVASPTHAGTNTSTLWSQATVGQFTPPAQGPRARSFSPEADGNGTQTYTWNNLKAGTYLYESGSRPSLQVPMGLYGVLVVTNAPANGSPGVAYGLPGANAAGLTYDADATLLFSEIDALQNAAVDAAAVAMGVGSAGDAAYAAREQRTFNDPSCATMACYPPAVNYAPTYFMINGQSYDKSNPAASAAIVPDAPPGGTTTGRVLLRMLNAGLKTHIPTVVGLPTTLIAEDGNLQPDVAVSLRAGATANPVGKVQSEVLLPAGKTADVTVRPALAASGGAYADAGYPVIDRQLSLSIGNKPDGGMQGYVAIAPPGTTPSTLAGLSGANGSTIIPPAVAAAANPDVFYVPANSTNYSGNVLANDVGIQTVVLDPSKPVLAGLTLNANGTFTYDLSATPGAVVADGTTFGYCSATSAALCATVTLTVNATTGSPAYTGARQVFTSNVATLLQVPHPGVLGRYQPTVTGSTDGWNSPGDYALGASDSKTPLPGPSGTQVLVGGAPRCVPSATPPVGSQAGSGTCVVTLYGDGAFLATASAPGAYDFTYYAINSQKIASAATTATVVFQQGSGVKVTVQDSVTGKVAGADYRWVIEQDDTYLHDPGNAGFVPPSFDVPIVSATMSGPNQVTVVYRNGPRYFKGLAVGTYVQVAGVSVPDYNGVFRINTVSGDATSGTFTYTLPVTPAKTPAQGTGGTLTTNQSLANNFHRSYMPVVASGCTGPRSCNDAQSVAGTAVGAVAPRSSPADVALDPTKRYYISVLPGDAGDPAAGLAPIGHTMGAATIAGAQITAPATHPVTVLVPENPIPPGQMSVYVFEDNNPVSGDVDDGEVGLGGFEVVIYDTRGSSGDQAGQITYDLFNQPLTNSLANTPGTGTDGNAYPNLCPTTPNGVQAPVGVIYTCLPVYDANGNDISPFTGMALIKNVIPGRIDVQAHPAAWREGAGENWIQVSTLEGTPNNDTFVHAGEPAYWQEFGPPGFHSFIGFLNPDHIKQANAALAASVIDADPSTPLVNVTGRITNLHTDRPPESKLNSSCQDTNTDPTCARAALNYTQCYVALNAQNGNGATVAFAQCDANGNFTLTNVPPDTYELFIWDQWLDQIKGKKSVVVPPTAKTGDTVATGDTPVFNWFTRIQETTYLDLNGNGKRDPGEPGLVTLIQNVRFRDGSFSNKLVTDAGGNAFHNELFPLFNWYVLESDQTRYKNTGIHIIYDAGGIPDQTALPDEYFSTAGVLNSTEKFPLPAERRVPGAKYFDGTTERIDPPSFLTEGMQGFINQTEFLEWGKQPFAPGENGGISGMIYFASVRAFDDPRLKVQNLSEPGIPRVQVNLYKRTTNPDGTASDVLVDTTTSSSWDDWANGYQTVTLADGSTKVVPNMNCPGQAPAVPDAQLPGFTPGTNDPFVNYSLGASNQFKCYDGQHAFNQVQPAPYDGYYAFPTANCTICTAVSLVNNSSGQPLANPDGTPAAPVPTLPPGQYVVEVVRPAGFEITKEEDKNILIGDAWISAAPQQFGNLSNIFILPDQATLNDNNPEGQNMAAPPCVGLPHLVPDYLTVVPEAAQVAPYAGQVRPLCDRKLVTVTDQMAANSDFQLWTPAPIAGHVTGLMLNDAAAEFDPFNPSFGEKFALPNAPVSVRDFNGVEILRAYTDKWGTFDFLNPSTWEANVPNPSGYAPNMLTYCMNDPGPVPDPANPGKFMVDPYYNPQYSDFCYTWPILPGITTYLDTPVLPISAFALHYAPVDCQYADATPAVKRVDGNWVPTRDRAYLPAGATLPSTGIGPYVDLAAANAQLTITALGDTSVLNPAYAGPTALAGTTYATNRITRHYGFGATPGAYGRVQLLTNKGAIVATLPVVSWSDGSIVARVPSTVPVGSYQLAIRGSNGVSSVDAVTITVDSSAGTNRSYRAPWYVGAPLPGSSGLAAGAIGTPHPIQDAIDAALPGDLILVDAGLYPELAVMWKPVRLQGVAAASTVIQATKYPNNKIADWRSRINLLFGLDPQGNQITDARGNVALAQIDPLPGQEITGGIVRLEPSALSTEEGAGITVLAANVQNDPSQPRCRPVAQLAGPAPAPLANFWASVPFGFYPVAGGTNAPSTANQPVPATGASRAYSDFACFPSRIDGLSVTGSDAGGGIYVNGWAHNLEISNNRVYGNSGPYAGGVRIGQPYLEGQVVGPRANGLAYDVNVNIHHNAITTNGTDEANAAPGNPVGTSGAGGGLAIEAGSDNFRVANNWICGNFSAGDGGGLGILGNSTPGQVVNNAIIFNEAYQQTGANFGGGIAIEGEPPTAGGLSSGVGNIVVDGNLIQGNSVRSGSGGGLRIAMVNGAEVSSRGHYAITVTNNMIVDNVAGWAGAGISIVDSLWATIEENTVADNDAMGLAGNLMNTTVGKLTTGPTTGVPGPAGIESETTSPALVAVFGRRFPPNARPAATAYSQPTLLNNIVYHNRSFFFDASTGTARLCASNKWSDALRASAKTAPVCNVLPPQSATGQCVAGAAYWDVGLVSDHAPTTTLAMSNSLLTTAYPGAGNVSGNPGFVKEYCNGGRVTPGAQFEPGSPFQPSFQISASATLDESGNFVDLMFGPISLNDPANPTVANGNYDITTGGAAYNAGAALAAQAPYNHDIHGTPRPQVSRWDIGADEYLPPAPAVNLSTTALDFGSVSINTTSAPLTVTVGNSGNATLVITGISIGAPGANAADFAQTGTCPIGQPGLAPGATCTVDVTFTPHATGARAATLALADNAVNTPQTVSLSGTGIAPAITLSRTSLNFGQQLIGTVGAPQVITVTSSGTAPLVFAGPPTIAGPAAAQFASTSTCPVGGGGLAPGATCTISASFAPTVTGVANASLSIADNVIGSPQSVTLSGVGTSPGISLVPNPLAFGNVAVGATAARQIVVTNTGTAGLVIGAEALAGANAADFAIVPGGTCSIGTSVQPGSSCTLDITFSPTAAGGRSASLTLSDNVAGSPQSVTITGNGVVPAVSLTPASLTFNGQVVGSTSNSRAITVSNTGQANLAISSLAISGVNGTDFAISGGSCTIGGIVSPGNACTVRVTFTPSASGSRQAALTIGDNASGGTQSAALLGTGTQGTATFATANNGTLSTLAGVQTLVYTQSGRSAVTSVVTIRNTGNGAITYTSATVAGIGNGLFTKTADTCSGRTIQPGSSCAVNVRYATPATVPAVPYLGTLTLIDNAVGTTQTLTLSGQ
jgi:large repetitive protein